LQQLAELRERLAVLQRILNELTDVCQQIQLRHLRNGKAVTVLLLPHVTIIKARLQLFGLQPVQRLLRNDVRFTHRSRLPAYGL
jgi:hypothetical protein